MRVLVAPLNYDHPQVGQLEAFNAVFGPSSVGELDYMRIGNDRRARRSGTADDVFYRRTMDFRPDWLWLQFQDSQKISGECLGMIRRDLPHCAITHWTGDLRPQVSNYLASICKETHITFCSSVGQIPMFEAAGAPKALYLQIGLDESEDLNAPQQDPPFTVPDVVFCGNHYGDTFPGTREREQAIKALMNAKIPVGVVGTGWPAWTPVLGSCHVKQQVHVWRAARVCLNVNHYNDVDGYYSDRQLIAMASGNPTVCAYIPGLEREFETGKHCVWYTDVGQLVPIVSDLLSNEELRCKIGAEGRREVAANHTWTARIRSIVPVIDELRRELAG
jgi:hypothetical protein